MQHRLLGVSHMYVPAFKLPDETAHEMGLYRVDACLCVCLPQVKFVPFNPTDKYTIATIQDASGGPVYRLMKGAPQVRLLCFSCGYFVRASGKAALEYVTRCQPACSGCAIVFEEPAVLPHMQRTACVHSGEELRYGWCGAHRCKSYGRHNTHTSTLLLVRVQVVLKNCKNVNRAAVEEKITEFAGRGYRALGLARAPGEGGAYFQILNYATSSHAKMPEALGPDFESDESK